MTDSLSSLKKRLQEDLDNKKKASFQFTWFNAPTKEITLFLINHSLAQYKLNFLVNSIVQLSRELIINAVKANAKRAWIKNEGITLEQLEADEDLMHRFKAEAVDAIASMVSALQKLELVVQIRIEIKDDSIDISIMNNSGMTPEELNRFRDRIEWAEDATDLFAGYQKFGDNREGAGLGLMLNMMLLKQVGLGAKHMRVDSNDQVTRVLLSIPTIIQRSTELTGLQEKIFAELENLPTFPENIQKVINMCESPDSDIKAIATEIEQDPALSTGILKIANSPAFRTGNEIKTVAMAASILGVKTIREMTLVYVSREIVEEHYEVFKDFWDHAQKTANYSKKLAQNLGFKAIADTAYIGGLLHDLGKIILYSLDPKTIEEINGLNIDRAQNSTAVLEEISLGMSHSTLGAKLATKWNFSPELVDMIENHHSPFSADTTHMPMVSLIHIADGLIQTEKGQGSYVHFDLDALNAVNIKSARQLKQVHEEIKTG